MPSFLSMFVDRLQAIEDVLAHLQDVADTGNVGNAAARAGCVGWRSCGTRSHSGSIQTKQRRSLMRGMLRKAPLLQQLYTTHSAEKLLCCSID